MARWQDSPSAPPTIAETIAQGVTAIHVHCLAYPCGHVGRVTFDELTVDPSLPFPKLEKMRFRCKACGKMEFEVSADWRGRQAYGSGKVPMR